MLPKRAETFSGFDQSTSTQGSTEDCSTNQQPVVKEIDLLGSATGQEQFELLAGNNNNRNGDQQGQLLSAPCDSAKVGIDETSISTQGSNTSVLPPRVIIHTSVKKS